MIAYGSFFETDAVEEVDDGEEGVVSVGCGGGGCEEFEEEIDDLGADSVDVVDEMGVLPTDVAD